MSVQKNESSDAGSLQRWSATRPVAQKLRRRLRARIRRRPLRADRVANRHGPELEPSVVILGFIYGAAILTMIARLVH